MTKYARTKSVGALTFKKVTKGYGACLVDHNPGKEKKLGEHYLYILGKPCGFICKSCIKEWIEIWEKYSSI